MIGHRKHKVYGDTVDEWVELTPGALNQGPEGIFAIIGAGTQGFGLNGEELIEFVRRSIHALLRAGAVPVLGGKGTGYEWIAQHQYGKTENEITEAIIQEWLKIGNDSFSLAGHVWFARPDPNFPKYVKME